MFDLNPVQILASIPAIMIVFSIFGYAEAKVATWFGDPTPRLAGRLTLSPMAHLDLIGTICIILVGFGWAKPVGVNPSYYKDTKKGMALTAAAGPLANLIMAFAALLIYAILHVLCIKLGFGTSVLNGVATFAQLFAIRNLCFMVFNIIPIPPLDGAKVLGMFLPNKAYYTMLRYERYSMLLIMVLSLTGVLNGIIGTGVNFFFNGIINLLNSAINLIL